MIRKLGSKNNNEKRFNLIFNSTNFSLNKSSPRASLALLCRTQVERGDIRIDVL